MSDNSEDKSSKPDKDPEIVAIQPLTSGRLGAAFGIYIAFSLTLNLIDTLLLGNVLPDMVKQSMEWTVLLVVMLSDPVKAWKEKKIPRSMWLAMAGGVFFGIVYQLFGIASRSYIEWAIGLQDNMIYALILIHRYLHDFVIKTSFSY